MADLQRALEIAVAAHRGQRQKNGLPYVLHPLTLLQAVGSVDAKIVAALHDVVEDSHWTLDELRREGFSARVLEALDRLSRRDGEDYDAYIERVGADPLAREVKLADLADNMNLRRIPELRPKDLERLDKYHRAWRRLGGAQL